MAPVIAVQGISKRYQLGANVRPQNNLREALSDLVRKPVRRLTGRAQRSGEDQTFWALRDVSFDVERGGVLGVIGRNGAGKSTLLKVLSRITEPTEGRIELHGRVASLLEVGTGFHPELTGRENVYLNGTILGMRRAEIARKFDQIVGFAGVERFVDTPVKRYSSGMYVRLAFAVAAHLEPEIMVVDEVLAVGDVEFQKKCLGKMSDVANEGRTVLFVSHNMAAVKAICDTAILLHKGELLEKGPVDQVIARYTREATAPAIETLEFPVAGDRPQFVTLALAPSTIDHGGIIEVDATLFSPVSTSIAVEMQIHDERLVQVAYTSTAPMAGIMTPLIAGVPKRLRLRLGPLPLATGSYSLYFHLHRPGVEGYHTPQEPLGFEVLHADPYRVGYDFKQAYGFGAVSVGVEVKDHD